jgi:hypothetical protein
MTEKKKNSTGRIIGFLATAIVLGAISGASLPQIAAQQPEEDQPVPRTPVVCEGAGVPVGLQLPDGTWKTRTIDQRLPLNLGMISATVPLVATVTVALTGSEPEWQELPVSFRDLNQTYTTRILVVPEHWTIGEIRLNVPSTGEIIRVESDTTFPVAVVEYVGATPLQVELPGAIEQSVRNFFNSFAGGEDLDLDQGLNHPKVPNIHVRWFPVSEDGRVQFISPDPDLPRELQQQLSGTETVRVCIIGAGSLKLRP